MDWRSIKMEKTPQELYQERMKRVRDAIQLKVPDRVPFLPFFTFFPTNYNGINCQEAMYDYDKLGMAWKKMMIDFEPDMYNNPFALIAFGPLLDTLDYKQLKWPGRGVSSNQTYQFVEGEYMKPEEYDAFLNDPTDFALRIFFPRIFGALGPFQNLPSIPSLYYFRLLTSTAVLGIPEVASAIGSLLQAGAEALKMLSKSRTFTQEMEAMGFPCQYGSGAYAPYDFIGDFYRGTEGVMLDMYRRPDKLLAAMEKISTYIIQSAIKASRTTGNSVVFMPMHKGLDGFMSLAQFKTFFWPPLKKVILALIDEELIPLVLWEGDCKSRLEVIRDIPRGKAIYWFERTDIFRAKEVLGDTVCIRGNVPASLLCTGSQEEVKEYCKKLIERVGKGGGFIMDGAIGIPDEAKPANFRAMADVTKEYGVYR
jgi:hypothetical protein